MVGGIAGIVGAYFVGPREGRFGQNGEVNPMPGHNMVLSALGCFILWFGWYGFNPGNHPHLSTIVFLTKFQVALSQQPMEVTNSFPWIFKGNLVPRRYPNCWQSCHGDDGGSFLWRLGCTFDRKMGNNLLGLIHGYQWCVGWPSFHNSGMFCRGAICSCNHRK
jgi:hypothetical protein